MTGSWPGLIHTGSSIFAGARIKYGDPLALDDVAIDFPDLTILPAHSPYSPIRVIRDFLTGEL
jgi:predicted TIM-barrel fold metal-dependent hydrolase